MNFQLCNAFQGGFLAYVDVDYKQLVAAFGPPPAQAYWDPDAGYDGIEWHFRADDGAVYSVYARWDSYRIGGDSYDHFDAFVEWLRSKGVAVEVRGKTHAYEIMFAARSV